jgi:hypothetical protein
MSPRWRPFYSAGALLATLILFIGVTESHRELPAAARTSAFFDAFDGDPPAPQPWKSAAWDLTVHSRDRDTWTAPSAMHAQHGPDCSPPPEVHEISTYEDAVYVCRDHLMTAIRGDGYAAIYLTPNHMMDFSAGEAVLRFDMSTLRTSDGDWIELWVTPFEDNLQAPLDEWLPDLNGIPRNAIHVRMENVGRESAFKAFVVREFAAEPLAGSATGYERLLTPSATNRDTFEVRLSQTRVAFGMPGYGHWWVDTQIPALGWTTGVVQFGHHSYNPTRRAGGHISDRPNSGTANTWHWDNVFISPAVPFSLLHADRRFVDRTTPAEVAFSSPAPPGSYLRFAGIGDGLELSIDGGASWEPAVRQAQTKAADEHFKSYWTPLPAGVHRVLLRGKDGWFGPWMARDISTWSRAAPE